LVIPEREDTLTIIRAACERHANLFIYLIPQHQRSKSGFDPDIAILHSEKREPDNGRWHDKRIKFIRIHSISNSIGDQENKKGNRNW
jgi:hypothetical protein